MSELNLQQLSANQRLILEHALTHNEGRVVWFPEHIKGGAQAKVVGTLHHKGFVQVTADGLEVTAAARELLGVRTVAATAGDAADAASALPADDEPAGVVDPADQTAEPDTMVAEDPVRLRACAVGYVTLGLVPTLDPLTLSAEQLACALTAAYRVGQQDRPVKATRAAIAPREPRVNKKAVMIEMLQRSAGASIAELMETTGWQQHSVRGALANLRNLDQLPVESRKEGDERRYFIAESAAKATADAAGVDHAAA